MDVKWPKGYVDVYAQIRYLSKLLLNGRVLAIDPSSGASSPIGYAVFDKGVLVDNATISIRGKLPIHKRLPIIYDELSKTFGTPDVLIIEEIHGSISSNQLQYAVGVTIAATRPPEHITLPLNIWKALGKADPTYTKEDANDARMIGQSVIMLATEFSK